MQEVVLVSGVRTAIGDFGGAFVDTPAATLGSAVIKEAVARAGIEPQQVDQVIMGCAGQFGRMPTWRARPPSGPDFRRRSPPTP